MKNQLSTRLPLVGALMLMMFVSTFALAHANEFTLSANPSNLGTVTAGKQYKVTITATGTSGDTVSLSESDNGGITATFNPTRITIGSGGSGTSTLTVVFECPVGSSPITVTGTDGTIQHNTFVAYGIVHC
jgi:hypothetical protein